MNFQQSKVLLDKINRLFEGMAASPEQINSIEKDLMMNYIRNFYEHFYHDTATDSTIQKNTVIEIASPPKVKPTVSVTPPTVHVPTPPPVIEKTPKVEPKKVEIPTPIVEKIEEVKTPVIQETVVEEIPVTKVDEPIVKEEVRKKEPVKFDFKLPLRKPVQPAPATPPSMEIDEESAALFESKKATELSEKLGQSPIMDLNKAFGLNDRMLYTNELFGGNNNEYKETMGVLNSLNSLEQAKIYLIENIAGKYAWTAKDKKKMAKDFIKTISRKYV